MNKLFVSLLALCFILCFSAQVSAFNWSDGTLNSYYKLDETSGTTAYDSLLLHNGTNNGAVVNQAGIINKAYSFDQQEDTITYSITNTVNKGVSMWVKSSDASGATRAIWADGSVANWGKGMSLSASGKLQVDMYSGSAFMCGGDGAFQSTASINDGNWHHIAMSFDGTNCIMWVDGVNKSVSAGASTTRTGGNPIIGKSFNNGILAVIDEVGDWNRTLTQSEITELYNSGSGLSYGGEAIAPTITLESPANGTTISDVGTNFTVSGNNLSSVAANWTNITYNVWQNGTIFNSTTVDFTDNQTFNQTLYIDNFNFTTYEWNTEACYTNVTGSYCISADTNNTLIVSLFTIVNETYVNDTIGGTLENFSVTLSLLPGYNLIDAAFIYNGTDTSPSIYSQGDNRYLLVSDYQIPIIVSDENVTFNWDLTFTGDVMLSTDNRSQLIRAVLLDNCSTYTNTLFNISLRDEATKSLLNGDIEVIYTLLNKPAYDEINTYSFAVTNKNNTLVCSGLNISAEDLAYSAEIRYVSDGYAPEFYHIQRADIGTTVQNIDLYDLNSSSSTEFKVTYQDSTFNFISGAIIQLQRKYISENIYETVEAPLTSADGTSLLHIDLNSIKYRATVVKNGEVLDEFDNIVFNCQSELTGVCEHKLLGTIDPSNDLDWDTEQDFYYSEPVLANGTITVTFSIPSGTPSVINLVLEQKDQFQNETLCNKNVTSTAGSISCTYSETLGDSYIDLYLYKDGVPMAIKTYVIHPDEGLDWLGNNYIFIVIMLLSLVGMALASPEWIIINGIVTMVISGGLLLANGLDFVMGLGNLVWLVIAAIILISKISKQEDR